MPLTPKSSYHPYILVAFYLNCLPTDMQERIPASTRHDWRHKNQTTLYGYDWYLRNQHSFDTLQLIVAHKRLLQINKAFLRVIALQKFIRLHVGRIKNNMFNSNDVILHNLKKITRVFGIRTTLKYLQQSYQWYLQIRRKQRCHTSLFSLCRIRHPTQLLIREINILKAYCEDPRFLHWPLASIFHQIRRNRKADFNISTFYKYIALLHLKRYMAPARRKNHDIGIRASAPLSILHADTTLFRTADNVKNYIYLVQDNFSRAILSSKVALECKARLTFDNLAVVQQKYLQPSGLLSCQLLTDDGSENAGEVKKLIAGSTHPSIIHLVAQQDVSFSNSMIEAANKQLKYRFLYHQHIPNHAALEKYVQQAVDDYNNRPHDVLNGLTPFEVLNGMRFDKTASQQQILIAKRNRIAENKKTKCCYYSF